MIARLVGFCTRHYFLVIALALCLALAGEWARRSLSHDIVPDLSDPQIVLVADWMGHPAAEVAASVTNVLTSTLGDVPGATAVRGASMSGMAYVDVVFDSASHLDAGRQTILDRVERAKAALPPNVRLQVGPVASSTGWVFQYALLDPARIESTLTLRRFQDQVLRPALLAIPGVAEVASVGGGVQQVIVEAQPNELSARGLAFSDLSGSLDSALAGSSKLNLDEIAQLPVGPAQGSASPPKISDVARVRLTDDMPTGLADLGGASSVVGGIVVVHRDADLISALEQVKQTLERERSRLHAGVKLLTVYDRLDLVKSVGRTLLRALAEEVGVVVLVILLFLLHARSALVPLVTLPLVLLVTFLSMWVLRVPATIMSLGGIGIALGMAVDADVVALEACHRRLETLSPGASSEERRAKLIAAAQAFAPAILTSLLITALSFLPVFAFSGETGRLLRPLALTKTLVVVAAAIVTVTVAPALRDRLLSGRVIPEFDNPLTRSLVGIYRPFVHFVLRRPFLTLMTAALAVVSSVPIIGRLGGEFLPRVDEGDLLFMPTTLPGVSPEDAAAQLRLQDRILDGFPEVETAFGKIGRADTATDPAPFSMAETTIRLKPRSEWPDVTRERWYSGFAPAPLRKVLGVFWPEQSPKTTAELVDSLDEATRLPGWTSAWTAPARARLDMMATGVRTPIGIRIVAAEPERLDALGEALRALATRLPGTRSAVFESLGGEPWLNFTPDPQALARFGVDSELAQATADLLIEGGQVGEIEQAGTKLRVRVASGSGATMRGSADQLRGATVRTAQGAVPLASLGRTSFVTKPATVRTESGELVAYVYIDLSSGTDLLDYVKRGQRELDHALSSNELALAPGERIEWTGQYGLLSEGKQRLQWIVPMVGLSMLALLFLQFRSIVEALIVLTSVPFALVGSFWTLYLLGYPVSAPVWVGLLSVVGLAMQTGVVMVVYIDEAFHRRVREGRIRSRDDIVEAHAEGTVQRLRPKLMTVTTMAAGLLPLLWAEGAGAEIMRRVAAPMVGGLVTSAFLTLEVLPVLYTIWRHSQLKRAVRTGQPLEVVVGKPPSWARV